MSQQVKSTRLSQQQLGFLHTLYIVTATVTAYRCLYVVY